VAAGYSLFTLVPAFARDYAQLTERQIGVVFFVNTGVIVIVQLPISRAIEGHRRLRALALMPLLWVVSWLMLDASGYWLTGMAAFVLIMLAMAIFGVGECFH
jgi:predicted MFS family arabinose efflux permease